MQTHNAISDVTSRKVLAVLVGAGLFAMGGFAQAHENPVDPVTNPQGLEFSNVEMKIPEYAAPFQRQGKLVKNTDVFHKIVPGMPASKVKALLGKPRKPKDYESAQQWNYVFTLGLLHSASHIVCQYKVTFDDKQRVQAAVWRRDQCPRIVRKSQSKPEPEPVVAATPPAKPEPKPEPKPVKPEPRDSVYKLRILFGLDLWKTSGIRFDGLDKLAALVKKLKNDPVGHRTIVIKGYAGPLDNVAYNKALSLRRAHTVSAYLLRHHVQVESMKLGSFGEADSVVKKDCKGTSHQAIAACHAQDRRVTVVVRPGF